MAFQILRILMFVSSGLIIVIGGSFFLLGPAQSFDHMLELFRPFMSDPDVVVDMSTPNVDGEIRTLAPFFVAYGVLVFMTAKHLRTHLYYVPYLLAVFFMAGIGRLISYVNVGTPHPLFMILLGIELGAPILLFAFYRIALSKLR